MNEQSNRTFVCSILFLDIVEYSKRSVAEQMTLKQRFNALLGVVLQGVAVKDRIVLDTGDGAAISFLGNPEDTLFAAMTLRDAIAEEPPGRLPALETRMGINLGPVRLIKDLNGQLNIIGDGINVAQRVMSFAEAGQILVSRSYYEVVSRLSPEYSQLFHYEGARTDKHVREHEVYAVGPTSNDLKLSASAASAAVSGGHARSAPGRPDTRLMAALALGVVVIIGAGVALRMVRQSPEPQPASQVAARTPPAAPSPSPAAPAPVPASPKQAAAKDLQPPRPAQTPPKARPKKEAAALPAPAAEPPRQASPAEPPAEKAAPPPPATLRLAIVPWGEVFVDGKSRGVSPPLRDITLSPGKHQVTVQNTTLPPYTQQLELKPGEQITIRHRFN